VKTAPAAAAAAAARLELLADTLEIFTNHLTTTDVIKDNMPPVLDYGTTFHLDSGGRDLPSTLLDNL